MSVGDIWQSFQRSSQMPVKASLHVTCYRNHSAWPSLCYVK